jgi:hypothetical protein
MAMLIPLLLPHVVDAAMNIGVGVSNAIQGTSSNVTLQIGGKVFSTRKKFNFMDLSYDLRLRIILLALEGSKRYIFLPSSTTTLSIKKAYVPQLNPAHSILFRSKSTIN